MKMEHYLAYTDYPICEVIQRGNGPVSVSTDTNGVIKVLPPKTAEEILARERERKARTTLLMALPEDHLAKFHKMTDAKEMWEAIKSRFGGNDESKKMQKYILKQQFEGFSVSNSEGLHKGYDRFQSLLSQLEIHGAGVSTEDANQKFLRSLPSAWSQVSLIMRTKPGVDSLSFDDLYNNLRVFESDVKGSTASSSSTQNVAFVSENTSSTNEVSTAYGASSSSGHNPQREGSSSYTDELMYSFFANQSSGPQLDHEDLEQLDEFDLEEMDLKWQVAMISMRLKKFYKKTGRKLQFDAKEPVDFDKAKSSATIVTRQGILLENADLRGIKIVGGEMLDILGTKLKTVEEDPGKREEPKALVTLDGEGVDWTSHSEDEQENYALMAYSNSGSDTENKVIVDSGCSRHMTRNKAYLAEYQDYNGGPVAFGGSKGYITSKGKIKIGKLDYEDVCFVKELQHFNLFSVSQMCDKKNKVLFTDTECFVLSFDFKLLDENQVLLRIPRQNNMYSFNIENIVPSRGKGPNWLFDLDYLTDSMNYQPVRSENQANKTAGPKEANHSAVDQEDQAFLEELERLKRQEKEANDAAEALRKEFAQDTEDLLLQAGAARATSTNTVNTASTPVSTASPSGGLYYSDLNNSDQDDSQIPALEDIYDNPSDGIFTNASYDDEGVVADFTNLESTVNVSPIPTSRIHSIHPTTQILGDPKSAVQTRSKVHKSSGAHAFKISKALKDESWVDGMQEELLQFNIQNVWILVDMPYRKKAIRTKWVYMNKKDERGVVVRNKARLVTQGHRQEEGIDYDEVFIPVARIEAIRIFLAFASFMGFIVYQMDVKSAFLYGKIDEEVYVSQPLGFIDPKFPKKVYKVVKALYGLHQAPKASYVTLSTFLLKSGYRRGTIHKTLFIKKDKNDIMLVQDKYVAAILKKFDFASMKTASTPIKTQKSLTKDEEAVDVDVYLYRSMIGSLMYLTASRPDIMFVVCACSRVLSFDLEAYSDSNYAGANIDRKSTTGEYVAAANCCGQVLWIQNQMLDYGFNFMNTKIYIDNESTICIVKNPVFHSKTKHIEIRHHFTRDAYEKKLIQRNLDPKKFLMYPRFLQLFLNNELEDLPEPFNDTYETPCHTKKVFTNMARKCVKFSGKITILFDSMLVPHQAPEGEGDHTSEKAEGGLNLEELFFLCTNLSNRVLDLETFKDAQAAEILKLNDQIKKLKRKCKPSISHHRAWEEKGRKNAKPEPTLDAFDDLDADGRDYIETEDVVKEGRQSNETEELNKGSGEKGGSTEELVSTIVPKIVSTARPQLSTARPDVDVARQEDSAVEPKTPPTTTSIFDDEDITMAQTLIKMKEEKAKEKGVSIKDIEDSSRPARSILTLKPLLTIDPKYKGKSVLEEPEPAKKMTRSDFDDAQIARDAEIARYSSRKFRAAQRSAEIRSRPPTKSQLRNLMMAYLKNMGGYKQSQLKAKTFAEIQEEEKLKACLKIVPDEEGIIDYEVTKKRFDRSSRWIKTFSEMVTRFDRLDLLELYNLVVKRFESTTPEDGTKIYMLAKRKYPVTKETLERILSLRLVTGTASEDAYTLLRFIQKQIDEYGSHDGGEEDF
ncbi:retrovirus-related pol polyprotein from transposon TNT 1-94 [Tanacetum coccineum]|uniref:Retrovirus-related pol polyprotein from transposon TNT 1-94 n=1 Tax=Tanacetum coccineum TaxID=301880 RepID=A0ABQ5EX03_9ASTR